MRKATYHQLKIHYYESKIIFTSTYIGTHIDVPIHFNPFGRQVEENPLEKTIILNNTRVLKIKKSR